MKRLVVLVVGLVFIFTSAAIAADKPAPAAGKVAPAAATEKAPAPAAKPAKMKASGVVTEVTDTALMIEVKVKGKAEAKEFGLEKPVKAKAGDKVTVSYVEKDGKLVATKVVKATKVIAKKKAAAKAVPAETPAK